ncbi:MAG: PatB family C-S lyase [Myxococcota bacterium]|nr:PatB family C-S lyase [Myxococcota bacterium]
MPKANLDQIDRSTLLARKSEKWHTYPADILPAWVAEMDFPVAPSIDRVLRESVNRWDVGYPIAPNDTGLREAFARRMEDRFDWAVNPEQVEILTEVVQGMYLSLLAYSEPGEGVVVQTPIYAPFLSAVRETGRELRENRLTFDTKEWGIDFEALEASIDPSTRVLLFCNPHNPSGRVFTRPELESICEIVLRHDLIVVSDEIHSDLLFDGRAHIPFGSLGPEIAARTMTLTSASKAFNIPGLRCAVAHFGHRKLQDRFNTAVPRHVRGGMGILGLYATLAAWEEGHDWLNEVVSYLERNRNFVVETTQMKWPAIRCASPQGTYMAFLDCSALNLAPSPARHFYEHGRLALSEGRVFGPGFESWVRLNFATSREILTEIFERMEQAVDPEMARKAPFASP